jgi:hypothetical protein
MFGFYACVSYYKNTSQHMTKLILKDMQFLLKYNVSILANNLDCPYKLCLAQSPTYNNDTDSNREILEAEICELLSVSLKNLGPVIL